MFAANQCRYSFGMQSVITYPLAGSIWGSPREYFGTPILFIIYMNDLSSCVTISKTLLFIDDTKLYNTVCFKMI